MISNTEIVKYPWVILGCGYVGGALARRLVAEHAQVVVSRSSEEGVAQLSEYFGNRVMIRRVDVREPSSLVGWIPHGSVLVYSVPPIVAVSPEGATERQVVLTAKQRGIHRIVYLSSTGVYPRGRGEWFDEETPPAPISERGRKRLASEMALLEAAQAIGVSTASIRIPGIYGPGRGVVARMRAGSYRIIGNGDTVVSRIHVDDLCTGLLAIGTAAKINRSVYTIADNEPSRSRDIVDAAVERWGLRVPPSVGIETVDPDIAAMVGANRRISNRRFVEEFAIVFRYPTWRQGLEVGDSVQ